MIAPATKIASAPPTPPPPPSSTLPPTPRASAPTTTSITPALVVWLTLQLLALIFAAARVPLSAKAITPQDSLAVDEMLFLQIVAAALLFPWMLSTWSRAAAIALVAGPMLQLAATLASHPSIARVLVLWAYVATWVMTLAIVRASIRVSWLPLAVAIASLLTLGAAALVYLHAEFGPATALPPVARGVLCEAFDIADPDIALRFTFFSPLLATFAIAFALLSLERLLLSSKWSEVAKSR